VSKYFMPEGMWSATLAERKEFYASEFKLEKVTAWLEMRRGKTKFAVIIGRHTKIYPPQYREDKDTTIIIDEYADLEDVRRQILEFLPEAVYYDRNVYFENDHATGQELAFDVDSENITCPIHGTLADKIKLHQGLSFCEIELDLAKKQTIGLYEYLAGQFSDLRVVYSGRGFHIHVLDQKAYDLTTKERTEIAATVKSKGFAIDAWVTEGEMRLIRLPYSLHGMVSRIAVPLEKKEVEKFNPVTDARCIPAYLRKELTSS
jgi:DNA primase catalytic subunit